MSWRRRPQIEDQRRRPRLSRRCPPDVRWAIESSDNLDVESPYAQAAAPQCSSTVDGDCSRSRRWASRRAASSRRRRITLGSPVVVIGQDVADHFFPNLDPIGRELRIQGIPYTVIGVAEKQGSVFGMSLDKFVHRPGQVAAQPLGRIRTASIDQMIIQAPTTTGCAKRWRRRAP